MPARSGGPERAAAQVARMAREAGPRARLDQVNPHFLFNTLNALSTLVMRGATTKAEAMILNLSNFFRAPLTREATDGRPPRPETAQKRNAASIP
ncbi:histidine kinase [Thermaurantiacus sp.]